MDHCIAVSDCKATVLIWRDFQAFRDAVSNHVAAMDDPLVVAALTPMGAILGAGGVRWSLCATDRCFKGPLMSAFFRAGQVSDGDRSVKELICMHHLHWRCS